MEQIRTKAAALWGVQYFQMSAKFTDATTPELRAAKLVRPYPTGMLLCSVYHTALLCFKFQSVSTQIF